jgi:uncharacterized protein with NRDE domain
MCLLVAISRVLPEWPLIVAANRDERYDRPTEPLTVLRTEPFTTLGGRDLLARGTWLAVNELGVVAGLTNKPAGEGRDPSKRSRGDIPLALTALGTATGAAEAFGRDFAPHEFNPCWALVGDRSSLYSIDMTQPDHVRIADLPPGVHVLENKPLGQPSTKVERVRELLGDVAGKSGDEVLHVLRAVLADHAITRPAAEASPEAQRAAVISSCCVHSDEYGTRSAMLIRTPRSPHARPEVWASDGPPCVNPFTKASFSR